MLNVKWRNSTFNIQHSPQEVVMSSIRQQIDSGAKSCIWMQAGVVRRKECRQDYECVNCRFDRALQRIADENRKIFKAGGTPPGKRGRIVYWKDNLKKLPPFRQPCLHSMKGGIGFRSCHNEYNCGKCEFDQFFLDQVSVHAVVKPVDVLDIHGIKIPQGYYLHPGHAWVKVEESTSVRIGIDDFALRVFGPLDEVVSPLIGKTVGRDQPAISLKRGSKEAKLRSPVSGVVTAVNPDLREYGHAAGKDPYSGGWIMKLATDNLRADLQYLMIGDESRACIEKDTARLFELIEAAAGPLAADGGQLGRDVYGNLPEIGWERLAKAFL